VKCGLPFIACQHRRQSHGGQQFFGSGAIGLKGVSGPVQRFAETNQGAAPYEQATQTFGQVTDAGGKY